MPAQAHNRGVSAPPLLWDIFCQVIDNHGDLGVCWRLARELAARGQQVRLWVDDASALDWMAPGAQSGRQQGVRVLPWARATGAAGLRTLPLADVWIEAFGCHLPEAFVAHGAQAVQAGTPDGEQRPPVWINLEYLSAEPWVERVHGLPSPVQHGPAQGWTKWFCYPGFSPRTGGLLREVELDARQDRFDRTVWLRDQGLAWRGEQLLSLFCYEPPPLATLLHQLTTGDAPSRLLVTAGRATQAVRSVLRHEPRLPALPMLGDGWGEVTRRSGSTLRLARLPHLPQTVYDELLWTCDLNFVRGEDSLVRALWAGAPLVWQIYPQHDDAHHAKLEAFLDWLDAPAPLRRFHRVWNGIEEGELPAIDLEGWSDCVQAARARLLAQPELCDALIRLAAEKR